MHAGALTGLILILLGSALYLGSVAAAVIRVRRQYSDEMRLSGGFALGAGISAAVTRSYFALPIVARPGSPSLGSVIPMPDRDYSHRAVVDKLGIKKGHAIAFVPDSAAFGQDLISEALERVGRPVASADERPDVVLIATDGSSNAMAPLREWRERIRPDGGIWLLTPKRGLPGYVNQSDLIPIGLEAGLVDNKTCSVSDTTTGIRFVIRRSDRPGGHNRS